VAVWLGATSEWTVDATAENEPERRLNIKFP
jgi:hypothetical protein